jgi:hypothetical protein
MATAPLQYHAGVVHAHDRVIYIIFSSSVVGSVAGEHSGHRHHAQHQECYGGRLGHRVLTLAIAIRHKHIRLYSRV